MRQFFLFSKSLTRGPLTYLTALLLSNGMESQITFHVFSNLWRGIRKPIDKRDEHPEIFLTVITQ